MMATFPASYRVSNLSFLLESPRPDPAVLYWMNPAALYAEMNKVDCLGHDVIWPHSDAATHTANSFSQPGVFPIDPEIGALRLLAPLVSTWEFAHPSKERRLHWSDGRHRTAAFAPLGASAVPLACTPADVPILERIEADFAAGLLPASIQPFDKSLCAAKERWSPFEVVVGVSSASAGQADSETARVDRRARQNQFKEKLADKFPGAVVRFTAEPSEEVTVHHLTEKSWLSRLLRVRDRHSTRLCKAAYQLAVEIGL